MYHKNVLYLLVPALPTTARYLSGSTTYSQNPSLTPPFMNIPERNFTSGKLNNITASVLPYNYNINANQVEQKTLNFIFVYIHHFTFTMH